jgi:cysteine desulfurase/selenocysteine lyase
MNQTDWNAVRARFPVCSRYTYLNAAGGSPMCVDASVEGKRYGDTYWEEWLERTSAVRERLAGFICGSKEEIGFAPNTSTAMGIIAQLLKGSGAVITMDDEFPSSTFPFINLGFALDYVQPENGLYTLNCIERSLRPEHKILITSYVQYKTGFRQNLTEIGEFCRSSKLIFIVNATQALGVFPVDVASQQIDFLAFSGLKWACAGYGAAGFYIRKNLLNGLTLPVAGWRSVKAPETMNNRFLNLNSDASALEAGSPSFPAVFSLGGALDLINRIGLENCSERVLYLSRLLEKKLNENGFPVVYSFDNEHRSGIIMVRTSNSKTLVEELFKRNIMISARGEGMRISVNIYNNENDINKLIQEFINLRFLF